MSKQLVTRLIEFAESGNQQKICIAKTTYQGWIMEITDEACLISTGYTEKNGQNFWLKFEDLVQANLYYWDNKNDDWQPFYL